MSDRGPSRLSVTKDKLNGLRISIPVTPNWLLRFYFSCLFFGILSIAAFQLLNVVSPIPSQPPVFVALLVFCLLSLILLMISLFLVWNWFGREVIVVKDGWMTTRREISGMGRSCSFELSRIRNLRFSPSTVNPMGIPPLFAPSVGFSFGNIAFDYDDEDEQDTTPCWFGERLPENESRRVIAAIRDRLLPPTRRPATRSPVSKPSPITSDFDVLESTRFSIDSDEIVGFLVTIPATPNWLLRFYEPIGLCIWTVGLLAVARMIIFPPAARGGGFSETSISSIIILCGLPIAFICTLFSLAWNWFGREIISIHYDSIVIRRDLGGFGRSRTFCLSRIRNFRYAPSPHNPLFRRQTMLWRGGGLRPAGSIAFDHDRGPEGAVKTYRFGDDLPEPDSCRLIAVIRKRCKPA